MFGQCLVVESAEGKNNPYLHCILFTTWKSMGTMEQSLPKEFLFRQTFKKVKLFTTKESQAYKLNKSVIMNAKVCFYRTTLAMQIRGKEVFEFHIGCLAKTIIQKISFLSSYLSSFQICWPLALVSSLAQTFESEWNTTSFICRREKQSTESKNTIWKTKNELQNSKPNFSSFVISFPFLGSHKLNKSAEVNDENRRNEERKNQRKNQLVNEKQEAHCTPCV